jgi:hypothetical protein
MRLSRRVHHTAWVAASCAKKEALLAAPAVTSIPSQSVSVSVGQRLCGASPQPAWDWQHQHVS